ncbi:MAG TPA: hypothetical protein VJZ91_10260, partial [Blastocatellia bacterium]|nr:hypothetical protein [Blastocatellia bacterium]
FDVDALAAQACGEAASIEEAAENFKRNGGEPLGSALAFVRTHWPDYFQRRAVDAEALKIAFFGMERGAPTLVALTFEALITSDTAFQLMHKILSCPGTIPADKSVDLLFGQTAASAGEMAKPSWRTSPIPAFRRLILAEAKARPDTVAPPIDILRIDALGPHWIK